MTLRRYYWVIAVQVTANSERPGNSHFVRGEFVSNGPSHRVNLERAIDGDFVESPLPNLSDS